MKRYDLIDTLRGLAIIAMIVFHTCWLMSFFGIAISPETLTTTSFVVFERIICITFILISGFCFSLGHNHLKSGLTVFGAGLLITILTCLLIPQIPIIFGILTFIGTSILIMIPLDRMIGNRLLHSDILGWVIFILSVVAFILSYNINKGYLGFQTGASIILPKALYKGYFATFIGFMDPGFYSADYFSLIPWFFIYLCGYVLHKVIRGSEIENRYLTVGIPGIRAIGRHSLLIYITHPIVIFAVLYLISIKMV